MNVLVVAPHLPPTHIGGVETYAQSVADRLAALGHRVEAVAVDAVATGFADACEGVTDTRNGYRVHRLTLTLRRGRSFPLLWDHAAAEDWLAGTIAACAPDVVHVHSGYLLGAAAIAAARRSATPVVVTLHDYWFACPRITLMHPESGLCSGPDSAEKCACCLVADKRSYRFASRATGGRAGRLLTRSRFGRAILRARVEAVARRQHGVSDALGHAAAVLSPTRFVAERVAAAALPEGAIRISPYGLEPLPPADRRAVSSRLRLAYMGQIAPHKGVHVAVEAVRAEAHPGLTLDVHGPLTVHRAYGDRLRRLAAGDARIVFRGAYNRAAVAGILADADAIVVPSVWYENAPLVIQEAHGARVPVIASRIGGIPELVAHERDGLLFEPGSVDDLRGQIQRLLSEPDLRARLSGGTRPPRTIDDDVQALVELYAAASARGAP